MEYDRRKDMEEISRLSKLLQESNAAKVDSCQHVPVKSSYVFRQAIRSYNIQ